MSYSFNIRAADKETAKDAVAAELDKVVKDQPVHARDRDLAVQTADDLIETLGEPGSQMVTVSVAGSVGMVDDNVSSVSLNIYAALVSADI